jgi:hypothetical protein
MKHGGQVVDVKGAAESIKHPAGDDQARRGTGRSVGACRDAWTP